MRELGRALAYPRLQKLWKLGPLDIQEHVQFIVKISELVCAVVAAPVVLKDPTDDPIVYAAVDAKADALCTLDRDFFEPEVLAFCRQRGVSVLTDVELLQKIDARRSREVVSDQRGPALQGPRLFDRVARCIGVRAMARFAVAAWRRQTPKPWTLGSMSALQLSMHAGTEKVPAGDRIHQRTGVCASRRDDDFWWRVNNDDFASGLEAA